DAIDTLIKNYCRESGVRNLKKHIDKVFRKAALKVVQLADEKQSTDNNKEEAEKTQDEVKESKEEPQKPLTVPKDVKLEINSENLKDYVGPQVFLSERLYEQTPPGVVMGLAWTSMGGSSLYIESVLESSLTPKSTPHLSKTGQLGDVMKESTSIAYTYAKSLLATHFPKNKFFDKAKVHLHCPAGAVPKDGPSAGVTMTTSLLSLALNKPVPSNIAMTGELTVTGKVLKIGGLKEKTIAAKRSKVNTILFPKDNQADWDELPEHIKEGMTGIPCDTYQDVYNVVFPNVTKEEAENVIDGSNVTDASYFMKLSLKEYQWKLSLEDYLYLVLGSTSNWTAISKTIESVYKIQQPPIPIDPVTSPLSTIDDLMRHKIDRDAAEVKLRTLQLLKNEKKFAKTLGLKWERSLGYGEAKTAARESDHYLVCQDLIKLMDDVLGIHTVGRTIHFYVLVLPATVTYVMYLLTEIKMLCNETNTFYPNSNTPGHLPQSSCISKSCGKTYSVIIMVEMLGRIFEEANLNSSNYWKLLSAFYHHPRKTKVSNISIFTPRLMQMPFLHLKPTWTKNDVMKAPRALCDL
ncbi:ATP-dependent Lon protease pim1, partial [Rhizopus azygosporus]